MDRQTDARITALEDELRKVKEIAMLAYRKAYEEELKKAEAEFEEEEEV